MNRAQLVDVIATKTGYSKREVYDIVDVCFKSISKELAKENGKVQIVDFGTFETKQRNERIGRNPRKPEETVVVPPSRAVTFKSSAALKNAVKKKKQLKPTPVPQKISNS